MNIFDGESGHSYVKKQQQQQQQQPPKKPYISCISRAPLMTKNVH